MHPPLTPPPPAACPHKLTSAPAGCVSARLSTSSFSSLLLAAEGSFSSVWPSSAVASGAMCLDTHRHTRIPYKRLLLMAYHVEHSTVGEYQQHALNSMSTGCLKQ
jgi:hypothetical protein